MDGSSDVYHRSTGPSTKDPTPETRSIGYALRYFGSSGKRARASIDALHVTPKPCLLDHVWQSLRKSCSVRATCAPIFDPHLGSFLSQMKNTCPRLPSPRSRRPAPPQLRGGRHPPGLPARGDTEAPWLWQSDDACHVARRGQLKRPPVWETKNKRVNCSGKVRAKVRT